MSDRNCPLHSVRYTVSCSERLGPQVSATFMCTSIGLHDIRVATRICTKGSLTGMYAPREMNTCARSNQAITKVCKAWRGGLSAGGKAGSKQKGPHNDRDAGLQHEGDGDAAGDDVNELRAYREDNCAQDVLDRARAPVQDAHHLRIDEASL